MAWLFLAFAMRGPQQRATHGDARFASKGDLAATGMLKPVGNGIVVGKMGGDLIRLAGTRHVLLSAPTRSGKGVGAVIPNLLTFEDSIVVLDIKQEAFDLTSGWRQQYGPVYLFNPFAEDLRTHRWNPLSYVKRDPRFRITDLQAIAAILYEDDPHRDAFWTNQARNAFLAASLYLWESYDDAAKAANAEKPRNVEKHANAAPPAIPTLGQVYRLFSGDGSTDMKAYLSQLAQQDYLSRDCKTAFANLTALAEQTFTSVIGSFQEPLHIFLNPILDAATSANDFQLDDLRKKRMTVYVGITPNKLAEAKKLLNLFFSQAININTQALPDKDPALKHQCLLLLDEFTSIGRVDIIAHAISYLAGYNVRVFCVIQSLSQLDATYGAEVARTMVTNLACQIVYTPREQRDANEYSEMLGYTTLRRRNRTRSHGQGGSVSYAEVEERRALMLPQELKALSPEQQIIFVEGAPHPIKCGKIRYYQDAFFKQRLKDKAAVKTLELRDAAAVLPAPVLGDAATGALIGNASSPGSLQSPPETAVVAAATPSSSQKMQEQEMINLGRWFKPRETPLAVRRKLAAEAFARGELPPVPVPPRLRELLKDYPEHIERLQEALNSIIAKPSLGTPQFEVAIWELEGETSLFVAEAQEELEGAKANGDPQKIAAAEEKWRVMRFARSPNIGLMDLENVYEYFERYKAYFP